MPIEIRKKFSRENTFNEVKKGAIQNQDKKESSVVVNRAAGNLDPL